MAWLLTCGCMWGGVYVSQLLRLTAGLAGSMQEYELGLDAWRDGSTLAGLLAGPTPISGSASSLPARAS